MQKELTKFKIDQKKKTKNTGKTEDNLVPILGADNVMEESSDENWALEENLKLKASSSTEECYGLLLPHKKDKKIHVTPLLFSEVNSHLGKAKLKPAWVLYDSGTSASIVSKALVSKLRTKLGQPIRWQTKVGIFETTE